MTSASEPPAETQPVTRDELNDGYMDRQVVASTPGVKVDDAGRLSYRTVTPEPSAETRAGDEVRVATARLLAEMYGGTEYADDHGYGVHWLEMADELFARVPSLRAALDT